MTSSKSPLFLGLSFQDRQMKESWSRCFSKAHGSLDIHSFAFQGRHRGRSLQQAGLKADIWKNSFRRVSDSGTRGPFRHGRLLPWTRCVCQAYRHLPAQPRPFARGSLTLPSGCRLPPSSCSCLGPGPSPSLARVRQQQPPNPSSSRLAPGSLTSNPFSTPEPEPCFQTVILVLSSRLKTLQ